MNKPPCQTCITLPACIGALKVLKERSKKWGHINEDGKLIDSEMYERFNTNVIFTLIERCTIMEKYIPSAVFFSLLESDGFEDNDWTFKLKMVEALFQDEYPDIQ